MVDKGTGLMYNSHGPNKQTLPNWGQGLLIWLNSYIGTG